MEKLALVSISQQTLWTIRGTVIRISLLVWVSSQSSHHAAAPLASLRPTDLKMAGLDLSSYTIHPVRTSLELSQSSKEGCSRESAPFSEFTTLVKRNYWENTRTKTLQHLWSVWKLLRHAAGSLQLIFLSQSMYSNTNQMRTNCIFLQTMCSNDTRMASAYSMKTLLLELISLKTYLWHACLQESKKMLKMTRLRANLSGSQECWMVLNQRWSRSHNTLWVKSPLLCRKSKQVRVLSLFTVLRLWAESVLSYLSRKKRNLTFLLTWKCSCALSRSQSLEETTSCSVVRTHQWRMWSTVTCVRCSQPSIAISKRLWLKNWTATLPKSTKSSNRSGASSCD